MYKVSIRLRKETGIMVKKRDDEMGCDKQVRNLWTLDPDHQD